MNNNLNAIAGVVRLSGGIDGIADIDNKTKFQVGLTGHQAFNDKLLGWVTATAGSDVYAYEVGVGHKLSDTSDLNLFYRYTKFSDVEFEGAPPGFDIDAKAKGVGLGVTFKF